MRNKANTPGTRETPSRQRFCAGALTLLVALVCGLNPQSARSKPSDGPEDHHFVRAAILIHAPVEVVWDAVQQERHHNPEIAYSRVLVHISEHESVLEERFIVIPLIGAATCKLRMIEAPFERIDYTMIESDHFKVFEGAWVFTPVDEGKSTVLELSSHVEMGLPVPRLIMDRVTHRKLEARLKNVKSMAEGGSAL